jgi:hypothetical protein
VSAFAVVWRAWKSIIRIRVAWRLWREGCGSGGYAEWFEERAPIHSVVEEVGIIIKILTQYDDDNAPHINQGVLGTPDLGRFQCHVCSSGDCLVKAFDFIVVFSQGISSVHLTRIEWVMDEGFRGCRKEDHLENFGQCVNTPFQNIVQTSF